MNRVSYFDLQPSAYGGDVLYQGQPFTGTAVIERDGALESEMLYVDGVLHGTSRAFSGGELSREASFVQGMSHGRARDWHDQGPLWRESLYAFGVLLHEREYALDGALVRDSRPPIGAFERAIIASGRAAFADAPAVGESLDE